MARSRSALQGARSSRRRLNPRRIDPRRDRYMHHRSKLHERHRICSRGSHIDVPWVHARPSDRHRPRSDRGLQLPHRRGNFRQLRQVSRGGEITGDHHSWAGPSTAGRIAARTKSRPARGSQFRRCVEEFRNAIQETSGRSAIEDAMIETKREGCLGDRSKRILLGFPMWHDLPTAHAEEQGLFR
jgi:hypothetical protein